MATKIEYLMAHVEDRLQDIANDIYDLQQENARLTAELEEARPILECLADMKRIYEAAFDDYATSCPDHGHIHDCLTHGHIRLAAAIVGRITAKGAVHEQEPKTIQP